MLILEILLELFMNAEVDVLSILWNALFIAGLWFIFRKCGVEGWWALVPFARLYKMGVCAGREPEGRVAAVVTGAITAGNIAAKFMDPESSLYLFLGAVVIILGVIQFLYLIRIYLGMIEVFGRKKWWIIPWALAENLVAPLWGLIKQFQPLWTVEDIQSEASNFFSAGFHSSGLNGFPSYKNVTGRFFASSGSSAATPTVAARHVIKLNVSVFIFMFFPFFKTE